MRFEEGIALRDRSQLGEQANRGRGKQKSPSAAFFDCSIISTIVVVVVDHHHFFLLESTQGGT